MCYFVLSGAIKSEKPPQTVVFLDLCEKGFVVRLGGHGGVGGLVA